jgi:hypothetical protein
VAIAIPRHGPGRCFALLHVILSSPGLERRPLQIQTAPGLPRTAVRWSCTRRARVSRGCELRSRHACEEGPASTHGLLYQPSMGGCRYAA